MDVMAGKVGAEWIDLGGKKRSGRRSQVRSWVRVFLRYWLLQSPVQKRQ